MVEVKPAIERVPGFRVAGVHCGLKKEGRLDFALIASDAPLAVGGVFTTNRVKAAPVLVDMERLARHAGQIRAVAVNTGCANACTGQQGIANARQTACWVAERLGCDENQVLVLSTGVIGTQLPMDRIRRGVDLAVAALGDDWDATARAIMTTDTRPKLASAGAAGGQVAGIAKGAGMIAPNMATMLSVIVTDAPLTPGWAQTQLRAAAESSFNRIVIDGDMSTNDTVLLLAPYAERDHPPAGIDGTLQAVSQRLAQDIVRDGEGVTRFITLTVRGLPDVEGAHRIANTIATSPLVKTAFFGGDANWGRIVAAAGRAGVPVEPENMRLRIAAGAGGAEGADALLLFDAGMPTAYSEERATAIFRSPDVSILLDCDQGDGQATVWTCDLSHEYVSINGDYRS